MCYGMYGGERVCGAMCFVVVLERNTFTVCYNELGLCSLYICWL